MPKPRTFLSIISLVISTLWITSTHAESKKLYTPLFDLSGTPPTSSQFQVADRFNRENEAYMQKNNIEPHQLVDIVLYDALDRAAVPLSEMENFLEAVRKTYGVTERLIPVPVINENEDSRNVELPPNTYIKNIFVILHGTNISSTPLVGVRHEPRVSCQGQNCEIQELTGMTLTWDNFLRSWALDNRPRLPNLNIVFFSCNLLGPADSELMDHVDPVEMQRAYANLLDAPNPDPAIQNKSGFWIYMNKSIGLPPKEYANTLKSKGLALPGPLSILIDRFIRRPIIDLVFWRSSKGWNNGYLFNLSRANMGNVESHRSQRTLQRRSRARSLNLETSANITFIKTDIPSILSRQVPINEYEHLSYELKYNRDGELQPTGNSVERWINPDLKRRN